MYCETTEKCMKIHLKQPCSTRDRIAIPSPETLYPCSFDACLLHPGVNLLQKIGHPFDRKFISRLQLAICPQMFQSIDICFELRHHRACLVQQLEFVFLHSQHLSLYLLFLNEKRPCSIPNPDLTLRSTAIRPKKCVLESSPS